MITLTIPNDDTIALRQFGRALIEIASEKDGHPADVTVTPLVISTDVEERLRAATETLQQSATNMMDELRFEGEELQGKRKEPEVDTTVPQVESLNNKEWPKEQCPVTGTVYDVDPSEVPHSILLEHGIDSTGTPWDERIHSASKALNADGTWRLRRKPKDMDEAQWTKYIEAVKTDTTDVNDDSWDTDRRPGSGGNGGVGIGESDDIEPPVTPPGDDFHTDAGVVTEQIVAGIPPLPVPPPVVVAPEVTEWDFPRLMTFLTERHGKIDVATVNMLLAQDGMLSVQELNAHPDKIGPFVARVKAHLGE